MSTRKRIRTRYKEGKSTIGYVIKSVITLRGETLGTGSEHMSQNDLTRGARELGYLHMESWLSSVPGGNVRCLGLQPSLWQYNGRLAWDKPSGAEARMLAVTWLLDTLTCVRSED